MAEVSPKEIFKMQNDINFLKKNSYAQARDMREVKNYLLGDEFHKGLKDQIGEDREDIKKRTDLNSDDIEALKASHQKIKYYAAALLSILGLLGLIVTLVKNWTSIFN